MRYRRTPEQDEVLKVIGRNIKKARIAAKIKAQADLAERAGISRTSIGEYELGGVDLTILNLRAIAQALNVPMSNLLGESNQPPGPADNREEVATEIRDRLRVELSRLIMEDVNLRQLIIVQHLNQVLDKVVDETLES